MNQNTFELAPSQIPEWYAYQLDAQSPVYNISFNHYFFDGLEPSLFVRTWQLLLDRHSVFRITFAYEEGRPVQKLNPPCVLNAQEVIIDKTYLKDEDVFGWQNKLAKEFGEQAFDFEKGPLFRLHLVLYPKQQSQLIFTVHHIIWDETSTINLIKEFTQIYTALLEGKEPSLPVLDDDYFGYVDKVHIAMKSGLWDKHKAYWLNHYSHAPAPLALPLDYSRPAFQTYNGDTKELWLPRELIHAVSPFLIANNSTLFIFYMAALAVYFYKMSGQTDFVLGSPMAGRESIEHKNILGCFAHPLPIRCVVNPEDTFLEVLLRMRDEVLCAFEHRHYPCVSVIEQLQHQKDHSRPKLFSVMAGVQNDKSAFVQIQLGQAKLYTKDVYRVEAHGARFDLALGLDPLGSDIKFFCTYNTDLFKPKTIQKMMEGIVHLIGQVVKQSNLKLSDYPLELDKATINCLQALNDTEKCFPTQASIHTLFEEQVVKTPDALAILEDKQSLSYKALNALSNQYAHYLKARGLQPNQGVALVLEPSSRVVALLLAVLKVGAFYVPLSNAWPKARIQKAMQSLDLTLLIEEETLDAIADLSIYSANNIELQSDKQRLAYVVQTSGTTNEPKNIPITHEGVVNLLHATQANYQLNQDDKVLWLTSFTFDASILELFWPLSFGASIVLLKGHKDPLSIATSLHTHQVTVIQMVPVLLKALCEVVALDNKLKEAYKLRLVISGGALLTRAIRDLCMMTLPGKLVNHYGPSEVTVDATSFDCELDFEGDSVPIGKPIANAKVLVVDSHLQPVPVGFTGEILVASPGLMSGYLPKTNDTPSVFVELALPGHTQLLRFYKTKDLGKLHESGVIYYQGRKDKQVKVNGNRVELEEIEHCLMSFPKINQAVVKLVKSQRSEDYLVAFVEAKQLLTPIVGKAGSFYQVTLGIRPDLIHAMKAVHLGTWPSYFAGSPFIAKYWSRVWTQFPDYQFCLLDESGEIAAVCNGIPLYWDETMEHFPKGWDEGIAKAFEQAAQKIKPNTILGLTGVVTEAFRSKGLSTLIVKAFRRLCGLHGMNYFFGPVRPVGMFETGHLDFASWVDCVDEQGEPKDHWLRTHKRLGATIVGAAPFSQLVEGTLSEWASWTGETWEKSGLYTRADTLQPIEVNIEEDYARYYDPSIWVMHSGLDALEHKPCDYFNTAELKQYLSEHLPSYMIPLHFQIMAQLPVNDSGKVNESLLLSTVKWSQSSLLMPQTDSQKVVFDIWKEVLGLDALGIEDDFFMLGGQSLQLMHMLEKVYRQFSVRVSIKQFYKTPTIKTLCDEVLVC